MISLHQPFLLVLMLMYPPPKQQTAGRTCCSETTREKRSPFFLLSPPCFVLLRLYTLGMATAVVLLGTTHHGNTSFCVTQAFVPAMTSRKPTTSQPPDPSYYYQTHPSSPPQLSLPNKTKWTRMTTRGEIMKMSNNLPESQDSDCVKLEYCFPCKTSKMLLSQLVDRLQVDSKAYWNIKREQLLGSIVSQQFLTASPIPPTKQLCVYYY